MPGKDTNNYERVDVSDAFDPAGVALGIIDADGTLKLANYGWCGDGRDRHAPNALQVKPGASCSQALRELAQRGDESAKRVLQAFDWVLSGVVRSIRCEFFEPLPQPRWFDVTINKLRDGAGLIVTSIDVSARRRATTAAVDLNLPLRVRRLLNVEAPPQAVVHANRLVQDVIALVEGIAHKHNIRIHCAFDRHNPTVVGDEMQLQEMLIALVLSTIDVTVSGNPEQRSVHITTTGTPNTVEVCVKHHCPESFGVGIGMPIVRNIVEAHGGSLAAHRLGDHGLSIQITLPSNRPKSNRRRLGPALI